MDQGAVVERAARSLNERVGGRIEVGQVVAINELRRDQFIAQTHVHRERGQQLPVILEVEEIHVLVIVDDSEIVELIAVARAGEKIREVCCLCRAGIAGAAAVLAESLAEGFATVDGIEVIDFGIDGRDTPSQTSCCGDS